MENGEKFSVIINHSVFFLSPLIYILTSEVLKNEIVSQLFLGPIHTGGIETQNVYMMEVR